MKKIIAGLFAAILTTAGLVAATSTVPASAACTEYVCVSTKTDASAPRTLTAGKVLKIKVTVKPGSGTAPIRGALTVTLTGPGGFKKTVKAQYNNKAVLLSMGKLKKPGKYKYVAKFTGVEGYRNSQDTGTTTVKKRRQA